MERFSNLNRKQVVTHALAFLLGAVVVTAARVFVHDDNPTMVRFAGHSLQLKDIEARMSPQERAGNTFEYKKQIAINMIREQLMADLAAKENLTSAAFVEKIKSGADVTISDEDLAKFLRERNFDRKKLSKAQLDNIIANMKVQKREVALDSFMNQALTLANIEWTAPAN